MIVQDQYSGYFHEVPDQFGDGGLGEAVYDGLGNPVGFIGPLRDLVSNIPIVGGLVNRFLPQPPQPFAPPAPAMPFPGFPGGFPGGSPGMPSPLAQFRRPWPLGWNRPQLPYTGLGPRRLYMRCAVWPGPRGLVPAHAANMPPGLQPGMPGYPGVPALPVPGGGGRARRRRSRRYR